MHVRSIEIALSTAPWAVKALRRRLGLAVVALGLAALPMAAAPATLIPSFTGLGDLPGGAFDSVAFGVSADGSVVVGQSESAAGLEAFRWQRGVMTGLGDLPGGRFESRASGVSADGSVVVGQGWSEWGGGASGSEAFRWQGGVMTGLGNLGGDRAASLATGVSADGRVVVGMSEYAVGVVAAEAFRWEGGTMTGLGHLAGGLLASLAFAVSADGSVVVGMSGSGDHMRAFRWEGGVMKDLGVLDPPRIPSLASVSVATAVSADGSVVVGGNLFVDIFGDGSPASAEPFRWQDGEMVGLGRLPGHLGLITVAFGVSADGATVVGAGSSSAAEWEWEWEQAFIWDEANGMRSLQAVLTEEYGLGPALTGWTLTRASAISADGLTFVGEGINPFGNTEAWVATVPEPQTWVMLAAGLGLLGWAARRRVRLR